MSKDDRELIEAPAPITPDDAPHWLKGWTPEFYAKQHNEHIGQMVHEVSIAGGQGGTASDWINLAKGYLRTIANNSPPQGGLHHSLSIIVEQLDKVATRLEALQAQPVGDRDRDVGWLIELPHANGGAPSWWCGNSRGHPIWLADANRAVRFSRKDDADLVIRTTLADHDYAWRIVATDHAWMTP